MNLSLFKYTTLFESDINNREINLYKLSDVTITGYNCYYPNALLYCQNKIYNPLDEIILSLQKVKPKKSNFKIKTPNKICFDPVFYFIYNVENYYHFIYDYLNWEKEIALAQIKYFEPDVFYIESIFSFDTANRR